ncbi:MAG: DUF6605 domain-containing protein [Myxococcota bacterium]|nr:DUF6605 domain-containing protein [Myxococcota bacterium]
MIAGYAWPQSVLPGEEVELFVSTTAPRFDVEVVRQGAEDEPVHAERGVPGCEHPVPEDVGSQGCRWPAALRIRAGADWRSGLHLVRLRTGEGEQAEAFFVVRAARPGRTLLVLSTSTWAAYNEWGGPSFYTGGHVSSLERPLPKGFLERPSPERFRAARVGELDPGEAGAYLKAGYSFWVVSAGWSAWERLFARWAEREGIALDYAVSQDLDAIPGLLEPYTLYLSVGHDEYWSAGMRDAVEGFVERGGRAAFFSGNTAFWQIRWERGHRAAVGYKMDIQEDPVFGTSEERTLSTMWSDPLVGRPENHLTGVSFTRGGYAHLENAPHGSGGYTVWRPEHWAFEGLALRPGDLVGAEPVVVGYECDGCELQLVDGRPVPTGADGTPPDFQVLATAPAHLWESHERPAALPARGVGELDWVAERLGGADTAENRERFAHGRAVMGSFTRGRGAVFTTGCTDWAFGLEDPAVARITRNVIGRFLG